jgi:hypothetical protein
MNSEHKPWLDSFDDFARRFRTARTITDPSPNEPMVFHSGAKFFAFSRLNTKFFSLFLSREYALPVERNECCIQLRRSLRA